MGQQYIELYICRAKPSRLASAKVVLKTLAPTVIVVFLLEESVIVVQSRSSFYVSEPLLENDEPLAV
jgi:hypothetical protein